MRSKGWLELLAGRMVAVAGLAALAACAVSKPGAGADADAGLSHLASPDGDRVPAPATGAAAGKGNGSGPATLSQMVEQSAIDLDRVLAERRSGQPTPSPEPATIPGAATPANARLSQKISKPAAVNGDSGPAAAELEASVPLPSVSVQGPTGEPGDGPHNTDEAAGVVGPVSPQQRVDRLADELAAALRDRGGAGAPGGYADAVALACLEALRPGAAPCLPVPASVALTPEESRSLEAIRTLIGGLCHGTGAAGNPEAIAALLADARDNLAPSQRLRITGAKLCRSVQGYGRYTPFTSTVFLAGRAQAVIVYVEVDQFDHREVRESESVALSAGAGAAGQGSDGERWVVELSQEVNLLKEADSTLQLRAPEETVVDRSRNKVRDFYLVQRITLPETLSVGSYQLKVLMRDKLTKAEAEASLPLTIVADPALAGK